MKRPAHGEDVTVFENEALALSTFSEYDIHHGFGQVIGANHEVGKQQTKHRVGHPQQAVAEIGLFPWLNGVDVGGRKM